MKLRRSALALFLVLAHASAAWSQCAPGIPGAGNPGCIPPTAPGSPYGQPDQGGPISSPAPAAVWEDRWGAVSMDPDTGEAGGTVLGTSKSDAIRVANSRCAESGSTGCTVVVSFMNQCAVVVQKPSGGVVSSGTAADVPEATSRAMKRCGDDQACKVLYKLCSYPARVK